MGSLESLGLNNFRFCQQTRVNSRLGARWDSHLQFEVAYALESIASDIEKIVGDFGEIRGNLESTLGRLGQAMAMSEHQKLFEAQAVEEILAADLKFKQSTTLSYDLQKQMDVKYEQFKKQRPQLYELNEILKRQRMLDEQERQV